MGANGHSDASATRAHEVVSWCPIRTTRDADEIALRVEHQPRVLQRLRCGTDADRNRRNDHFLLPREPGRAARVWRRAFRAHSAITAAADEVAVRAEAQHNRAANNYRDGRGRRATASPRCTISRTSRALAAIGSVAAECRHMREQDGLRWGESRSSATYLSAP